MDTISNIASSASKLIYGDPKAQSGEEPISGLSGRGTVDEPYDSGNLEGVPGMAGKSAAEMHSGTDHLSANPASDPAEPQSLPDRTRKLVENNAGGTGADHTSSDPHIPLSGGNTSLPTSTTKPATGTAAAEGGTIRPEHDTPGTGVTSAHSPTTVPTMGGDVRPTETSASDSSTANIGGFGKTEPSVGADPASGVRPDQKQQGGDRPAEAPTTDEEVAGVKAKKDEAEAAVLGQRHPDDHSGEPLKTHDREEEQTTGPEVGEDKTAKGTGEKIVKQTAFKADGGEFDASLPGAGREADRLREEKDLPKSDDADSKEGLSTAHDDDGSGRGKTSVGTKIKEKLHIGSKHKNGSE